MLLRSYQDLAKLFGRFGAEAHTAWQYQGLTLHALAGDSTLDSKRCVAFARTWDRGTGTA